MLGLTAAHGRGHLFRALMEAAAFAVRHNLETMREAGATIAGLRSSGGGAAGALWPQIVSDVTGLAQDVREGPSRAGVGAALFAAVAAGAASLQTPWPQPTESRGARPGGGAPVRRAVRVVPRARGRHEPRAHALAAWQRDALRGTMAPAADREGTESDGDEGGRDDRRQDTAEAERPAQARRARRDL